MQANDDLAAIADEIKQSPKLSAMIATASNLQLMQLLRETPEASAVLEKIMAYLHTYGHQGYSLDFVEPTQIELVLATRCIRQLYTLLRRNLQNDKTMCVYVVGGRRDLQGSVRSLHLTAGDGSRCGTL
jgi:spore germination protein YaaH